MHRAIRILVIDQAPLVYRGLQSTLRSERGLRLCGLARTEREALQLSSTLRPDLIVLEPAQAGQPGYAFIRELRRRFPKSAVIVLTRDTSALAVRAAFAAGAKGYVTNDTDPDELPAILRAIAKGHTFMSPSLTHLFVPEQARATGGGVHRLTPRETLILQSIARGLTSKEIASQLGVSLRTIDAHRANILKKLNLHTAASLVSYAVKAELLPPS